MITHILLSLPNPSQIFIDEYDKMAKYFLGGGGGGGEVTEKILYISKNNLVEENNSDRQWLDHIRFGIQHR